MSADLGLHSTRASVLGADRGLQVVEGGKKRGGGPPPNAPSEEDGHCPVIPLGHVDGLFHFLDTKGQKRELSARQLGSRHELIALFFDDNWLRKRFPKKATVKRKDENGESSEEVTVDFQINRASAFLIAECGRVGIFGDHLVLRRPGVWPGSDRQPVVHCGDVVIDESGLEQPVGRRTGNHVWGAAPPTPRPVTPCDASVAQKLQEDLRQLWNFKLPGGEIAAIGLLGTAYYGAAAQWRPAGFLYGGAGSGKSSLLQVLRACTPMHTYTNDTTKSGLETALDSQAMPSFVDEASDQDDQRGARRLMDLILTSSSGEGTKGLRGGDGRNRFQVAGTIIMASINPPEMKAQHLGRFTMIELVRGEVGVSHRSEHAALVSRMRSQAAALWGRALSSWERYCNALSAFGAALGRAGCNAREMDQMGAVLAGWWVLTNEGAPDERQADEGVGALQAFITGASDAIEEDAPRRMVKHLLSKTIQLNRSTERAQVGTLIERILRGPAADPSFAEEHGFETARKGLADHGMRVIRAEDPEKDNRGRVIPRGADGAGVWFATSAAELRGLFDSTDFDGARWQFEMLRLESARRAPKQIRVGTIVERAIWVSAEELGFGDIYG